MCRIYDNGFSESVGLPEPTATTGLKPYKKNAHWTDEYIHYAWEISGHDKRFIYLLACENGEFSYDRRSDVGYKYNGKWYYDYGFCQVSAYFHPQIVSNDKFFTDWKWQMDQCHKLYKGGTKFYGLNNINKCKKIIEFK